MRSADGSESVEDFSLHSRALDPVANFEGATHILNHNPSGGDSGGDPPVPIPNTEVKPSSADGTGGGSPRESRSLPGGQKRPGLSDRVEIDDKPPGSFRKKSVRGCMFMGNKQIKEIRFGKLGGSQSLFLSSRGARPFFLMF